MARRTATLKIICPTCGKENEYSPAVGCLIKCRHCAEWFGEPTPLESELITCSICAQELGPTVEICPCCSHPLPVRPAPPSISKPTRDETAGKIIVGLLFATFGIWLLLSAWHTIETDQHQSDTFERHAIDMNQR